MWIFAGVPLSAGVKRHWGLIVDDGNFWQCIGGYVFENFRDTACNNYVTICYPLPCRPVTWLQNEWPWTLSGYFMTKSVFVLQFFNQSVWKSEIVQPRRNLQVTRIQRKTAAQMTRAYILFILVMTSRIQEAWQFVYYYCQIVSLRGII